MRRTLLALVALAALAACTDSTPTGTRSRAPDRIRSDVVTPATLEEGIEDIIAFWPPNKFNNLMSPWIQIENKIAAGQFKDARLKFYQFVKTINQETPNMGEPGTGESKKAAAARMIVYAWYYVFGGPLTPVPVFETGGDVVVGTLEPGKSLKLITPSGNAGVLFQKGSVDENRIIILKENPDPTQYGDAPCNGPLTTLLCQYPLFYDIESLPDGPLLKVATAAVCHPPVDAEGGPPDVATHDRLRLAHPAPEPGYEVPGGSVRTTPPENIEILPLVSQSFFPGCEDVVWDNPVGEGFTNLLQRGARFASVLASRVGKFLTPRSAYAIDQGAGGEFIDFGSPFNNVDPCDGFFGFVPEPTCDAPTGPTGFAGPLD